MDTAQGRNIQLGSENNKLKHELTIVREEVFVSALYLFREIQHKNTKHKWKHKTSNSKPIYNNRFAFFFLFQNVGESPVQCKWTKYGAGKWNQSTQIWTATTGNWICCVLECVAARHFWHQEGSTGNQIRRTIFKNAWFCEQGKLFQLKYTAFLFFLDCDGPIGFWKTYQHWILRPTFWAHGSIEKTFRFTNSGCGENSNLAHGWKCEKNDSNEKVLKSLFLTHTHTQMKKKHKQKSNKVKTKSTKKRRRIVIDSDTE